MQILQVEEEMVILTMDNYSKLVDKNNEIKDYTGELLKQIEQLKEENLRIMDDKSVAFIKMDITNGFLGRSTTHKEFSIDKDHEIVKRIIKGY